MKKSASYAMALALLAMTGYAYADARSDYYQRRAADDQAAFHALDSNRDGVVERDEIVGDNDCGPRFVDMDRNRDGVVTQPELALYIGQQYGIEVASAEKPSMVTQPVAESSPPKQD
jgi:hypothetical protein